MAKLTHAQGATNATADNPVDRTVPEPELDAQEPQEAPEAADGTDTPAEALQDDSGAQAPAPEEATPGLNLPAVNALKSVWEDTLLGAGVAESWVRAEGRTKDQLMQLGQALVDGTQVLGAEGQPVDVAA